MKRIRNVWIAVCLLISLSAASGVFAQTIIVDNSDAGFSIQSGTWTLATAAADKYGADYRYTGIASAAAVRYTPNIPTAGFYKVSVWHSAGTNRPTNAPFTIVGSSGSQTVNVNQQINGGQFVEIGIVHFNAGTSGYVSLSNTSLTGPASPALIADAVKWEYNGSTGEEIREMRGVWVNRFEWPQSTWTSTRSRIDTIVSDIRSGNFNSIFFQMRGQMNVLYPSPYEPIVGTGSSWINNTNDPITYAVQKTQAAGMQFHAYINTHAIWQGSNPPSASLNPTHPFHTHGNPSSSDPAKRDWVMHLSNGLPQPMGAGEDNYVWCAPGVPSFQEWTRRQIVYVANRYNVDGIHLDRIRFAGQGSYDPISTARSATGSPTNPNNLAFRAWNRDQITRLLNDIYGAIAEINYNRPAGKRQIALSSAPYRSSSSQLDVNQDLNAWTAIGAQDFFVPQIYVSSVSTLATHIDSNLAIRNGRYVVSGIWRALNDSMTFEIARDLILKAREKGLGTVVYNYGGMPNSEWSRYVAEVYPTFVNPPTYPWLDNPTDAIIVGTITGPDNQPVSDAQIKRNGSTYTWLSGYDGFYSMLKVPANSTLTLTANKQVSAGLPAVNVTVNPLTPGEVRRVNIQLGGSSVTDWTLY